MIERRLVGLSALRLLMGVAGVWYYLTDIENRYALWGPQAAVSPRTSRRTMATGQFSLYLVSDASWWFNAVFFTGFALAIAFTIRGGRLLTALHAAFLISLYLRNTMITEGGDNLVSIVLVFLPFTVTDAYFSPGASNRRRQLDLVVRPRLRTLVHNAAATMILFQVATVYVTAGAWKLLSPAWRSGQAMYYISSIPQFSTVSWFHPVMSNAVVGWTVCWSTIVVELAFPLALVSRSAMLRRGEIVALEFMHLGIMVTMGLVPFGMIMLAADSAGLTDEDYLSIAHLSRMTGPNRVLARPSNGGAFGVARRRASV